MVWVKLDDQFPDHPKVVAAGPLAGWLHICGLAYSNRHLTNGFVPRAMAHRLTDFEHISLEVEGERGLVTMGIDVDCESMAGVLCRVGLWSEVEGGYQIHDFLDYQPSREEVESLRQVRKEAGRRGGQASAQAKTQASAEASAEANAQAKSNPVPVPVPVPVSPSSLVQFSAFKPYGGTDSSKLGKLCKACGVRDMESEDAGKLSRAMRGVAEVDIVDLANSAPVDVRNRLHWTLAELKKRRQVA